MPPSFTLLLVFAVAFCLGLPAAAGGPRQPLLLSPPGLTVLRVDHELSDTPRQVQEALKTLGLYSGPVDGKLGPASQRALSAYAAALGLPGTLSGTEVRLLLATGWVAQGTGLPLAQAHARAPELLAIMQRDLQAFAVFQNNRNAEAELLYRQIHADYQRVAGPQSRFTLGSLNRLGSTLFVQSSFAEAETVFQAAFNGQIQMLGPDHHETLDSARMLALIEIQKGRQTLAAAHLRQIYVALQEAYGPAFEVTLAAQSDLGAALLGIGRYGEAEAVFRDLLAHAPPAPDRSNIQARINLAQALSLQGRYSEAQDLLRPALAELLRSRGPDSYETLTAAGVLGGILADAGRGDEAAAMLTPILDAVARVMGEGSGTLDVDRIKLAEARLAQGRPAEAVALARTVLASQTRSQPDWSLNVIRTLGVLGDALAADGRAEKAEEVYRQAIGRLPQNLARNPDVNPTRRRELQRVLQGYLSVLAGQGRFDAPGTARSFVAQSWWRYGVLELAVSDLGARLAARDPSDAAQLRAYQDLRDRLALEQAGYDASFSAGSDAAARSVRAQTIAGLEQQRAALAAQLAQTLPQFAELAEPRMMTVEEAQAYLRPGEGMLALAVTDNAVLAWLVTRTRAEWRATPVALAEVEREVAAVRSALDLSVAQAQAPQGEGCALSSPKTYMRDRPFDLCAAEALYRTAFGGFDLTGIGHLIVVPDGPFEALPFALLVTGRDVEGRPQWLIDKVALSVLPTAGSLRTFRQHPLAGAEAAPDLPYLGIAPGDFSGHARGPALQAELPDLPETVTEVERLATLLGAGEAGTITGQAATEHFVETAPLDRYRVMSFATHGLMAAESEFLTAGRIDEPALALAGPDAQGGDGFLTASEAAALKLDADWVILSGCNTAAGEAEGAQGLSGLARSFLFAGARSLLVSHWSVDDVSTRLLITGAIDRASHGLPGGKAMALRGAMLEMKAVEGLEHPYFWAPFDLVGEGLLSGTAPSAAASPLAGAPTAAALASRGLPQAPPAQRGILERLR